MSTDINLVQYNPTAKMLHWLVAGMVVTQFILANLAERAEDAGNEVRELELFANHRSVGITILALMIFRLIWRLMNNPPALPGAIPKWQVTASRISHWSMYGVLFVMPITGWLMSSASGASVSWFNIVQLPDFVAQNHTVEEVFEEIHETLAKVLALIAVVHIAAAIKHAAIDKNVELRRMISPISFVTFIAIVVLGATWLGSA